MRLFWAGAVAGWAVMGVGFVGLWADEDLTRSWSALRWLVGLALVHDLLLAPVVIAIGVGAARLLPRWCRGPVRAALIASGMIVLFAIPFVRGYGRISTNPSILPRNYGAGLALLLAIVWGIAATTMVVRAVRERRLHWRSLSRSANVRP